MAKSLNYSDYKSAGVYFLEEDNSVIESIDVEALRLAVGFSKKGPYNVPVFLNSVSDAEKYFGTIDTKLERKGSFFQRSLNTLLKQAPVFALNLLRVDERDKSELQRVSVQANKENGEKIAAAYDQYFDRSKFWYAKPEKLQALANDNADALESNIFNIANTGTKDITVFIRKAENVKGYNVTAKDFYGAEDKIPYKWILPSDYLSDYFIQVIVVEGKWDDYKKLSTDSKWKDFFSATGVKKDKLSGFLADDAINVIGNWTGTIIPDFYAKNGQYESIVPVINQATPRTGFMVSLNEELLETIEDVHEDGYVVDLVGHTILDGDNCKFNGFLSYPAVDGSIAFTETADAVDGNMFAVSATDASGNLVNYNNITIGDLIVSGTAASDGSVEDEHLSRVIKKTYKVVTADDKNDESGLYHKLFSGINKGKAVYVFTCTDKVADFGEVSIKDSSTGDEIGKTTHAVSRHRAITDLYDSLSGLYLKGLEIGNRHIPGYDKDGNVDIEAGIEKIYGMLDDAGIHRGLTNTDMIMFRYIIDTMGGGKGQGLGGKKHLSMLAKDAGSCTAILSYPSMEYLASSEQPIFRDINGRPGDFDTKYLSTGGNPDAIGAGAVTLPSEDEGSKFTGVFAPYLKYTDGVKNILVPPAADVANAYYRKFSATGNPYITVANMNGVLSNSSIGGVEYMFDKTDRDNIEPYGINPIITRNGKVLIYGDKTAYQDVISDYNYLHVRELLNTIEIEVQAKLHPYVFKYNTAETRAEIVRKVTPILQAMQDSRALYSFEIQMDENNNTDEVIERSYGILDIGVKMGKNLEKIVTRIKVNRLSA